MFNINKIEINWAGKKLTLETGKIGRQADASVVATYGGTTVMANVVAEKIAKPDMDFFPAQLISILFISNIYFPIPIST